MSHVHSITRSGAAWTVLLISCLLLGSCSLRGRGGGRAELDRAIESFIAGDYQAAAERLEELSTAAKSEEEKRGIYLYLGRSYVALERYNLAIDAFTAGLAIGGGMVFEEYLTRLGLLVSASPEIVSTSLRITRGQLAALIDGMFYSGVDDIGGSGGGRGAAGAVVRLTSVRRGVVPTLADGRFHADEPVTRAAFYAAVARLVHDTQPGTDPSRFFESGYDWVLAGGGGAQGARDSEFVSGKDAVTTLRRVMEAGRSHGG
jgi:hypothetical protein